MAAGDTTIVRVQFTGWDEANHPYISNSEYLEYESRSTHLSKDVIISYGYQRRIEKAPGSWEYQWIKREEALSQISWVGRP